MITIVTPACEPFALMDRLMRAMAAPAVPCTGFPVDIRETPDKFVLEAELPGFARDDITVQLDGDVLTLAAGKADSAETGSDGYVRKERRSAKLSRRFDVAGADKDRISASYENGVLSLDIPKAVPDKPPVRRIEIA